MSASKGKFTLRPSALSQHTADFNKILEQLPAPKIDSLNLIKPTLKTEDSASAQAASAKPAESTTASAPEEPLPVVFGQNLTDRVINTQTKDGENESSETREHKEENGHSEVAKSAKLWSSSNENEYVEKTEQDDMNTLMKMNCKLYVLDSDKANWTEKGYGMLKVIDMPEEQNCKIMMWMDKSYRLLLNTKLFEKMTIEKLNKKSIRFNAFEAGTIKIFLVKASQQTDCDELYDTLNSRLAEIGEKSHDKSTASDSQTSQSHSQPLLNSATRKQVYQCECSYSIKNQENQTAGKLFLYTYNSDKTSLTTSSSHHLVLDLKVDESSETSDVSTFLKLIRMPHHHLHHYNQSKSLEFEVESNTSPKKVFTVHISDKTAAQEFLALYDKEPKVRHGDSSGSENDDSSSSSASTASDVDDLNNSQATEASENEQRARGETNRKSDSTFGSERYSSGDESKERVFDESRAAKRRKPDESVSTDQTENKSADKTTEDQESSSTESRKRRSVNEASSQEESSEENIKRSKLSGEDA